ncbi:DUF6674 family protein [Solibaculum mannosilyticum]|uniref:DUF6674 family protein n=1 Tax=Solibaculum mannosilyticum TaxID=2780922 RepID=UPI0034B824B6
MEPTAWNLSQQPEFIELISALQENGLIQEKQEVESIASYLENMEMKFGEVLQELQEVRGQLSVLQEKGVRSTVKNVIFQVETKVTETKTQIAAAKNSFLQSAANAVTELKEHGLSAFQKALSAMRIPQALSHLRNGLHNSVQVCLQGASTVSQISREIHEVREHAQQIGRIVRGKPQQDGKPYNPQKGFLGNVQKLLLNASARFLQMEKGIDTALDKWEGKQKSSVKRRLQKLRLEHRRDKAKDKSSSEPER